MTERTRGRITASDLGNPLAFPRGERRVSATEDFYTGFLTPDIARRWLEEPGMLPDCKNIVLEHGMRKFDLLALKRTVDTMTARDRFIAEIGFGVPCMEAIRACVDAGPIAEVGAGSGFWAALIARRNGDIIACDLPTHYQIEYGRYFDTAQVDAEQFVRDNPDRHVLMVWPCYEKDWGGRAVAAIQPGRKLFLVHEGNGGCCGDETLYASLERDFEELEHIALPVWPMIGDYMTVYQRR